MEDKEFTSQELTQYKKNFNDKDFSGKNCAEWPIK